jgi:hypothetical protein
MKKVIIALIIVAAIIGIVLYFKSRKNKGEDGKNEDPAKGENGADAPGAAAAGSGYKNKSMSPEEAVANLSVVKGNPVGKIQTSGLAKKLLGNGKVQKGSFGPSTAQLIAIR